MAGSASGERPAFLRQLLADLAPFPGRAALTWRIALLCALVAATAMLYGIPEAAISCYLIIFLMKPDAVANIATAIGLIVLVTVVVACVVPLISATVESPLLRLLAIAAVSFVFLFAGAASQLGETGGVIALVIAYVLALVSLAPVSDAVSFGLRYAWYMAAMPMALMILFNLFLGLSPVGTIRQALCRRLAAAAEAVATPSPEALGSLGALLREGNDDLQQRAGRLKLLAIVGRSAAEQIERDMRASYRLLLAVAALPDDLADDRRAALAAAIRGAHDALQVNEAPPRPTAAGPASNAAEHEAIAALAVIAGAPESAVIAAPKTPFLAADALSNPTYRHFALKTTAAAVICYLAYTGLDWQGIHTAMITCYVAALGTTAETVHKLGLRILGCLVGAAMGIAAILFVIPQIETVAALMVLVFAGVFVGAWVSTGNERISYGGVQIALAFLLTVLQGSGPSLDFDAARDRIFGILLGNVVVYLIFTRVWPVSIESAIRARLKAALRHLVRLAELPPEQRAGAVADAAAALQAAGEIEDALELVPFEPPTIRPSLDRQARMRAAGLEIASLIPEVYLAREPLPGVGERLAAMAARIDLTHSAEVPVSSGGSPALRDRLDRLQAAVGC